MNGKLVEVSKTSFTIFPRGTILIVCVVGKGVVYSINEYIEGLMDTIITCNQSIFME